MKMTLSIFSVSDAGLLGEIFSYETSENLFIYTQRVDIQWKKAAMIELLSRHTTSTDILYQEKLFKENFNQRLKQDNNFVQALSYRVVLSMGSPFSTPTHKLQASYFLCKVNELPNSFISDSIIMSSSERGELFDHFYLYNNANKPALYPRLVVLASTLSSARIDSVVSTAILQSNDNDNSGTLNILKAFGSRATYSAEVETYVTAMIPKLNNDNIFYILSEIETLVAFSSKLKNDQINTIITRVTSDYSADYSALYACLRYLRAFSSRTNPAQTYTIVTYTLAKLNDDGFKNIRSEIFQTLSAFVSRLNDEQVEELIQIHVIQKLNNDNRDAWIIYKILPIFASRLSPELAFVLFSTILATKLNISSFNEKVTLPSLRSLASRFKEEQVKTLIENNITTLEQDILEWSKSNNNYSDDSDPKAYLNLTTLTLFASKLTQLQVDIVFANIADLLNKYPEHYIRKYALNMVTALASRLNEEQITTIFHNVLPREIDYHDCYTGLREAPYITLTALADKLNTDQIDEVFTRFVTTDNYLCLLMLNALLILAPKLTETQRDKLVNEIYPDYNGSPAPDIDQTILTTLTTLAVKLPARQLVDVVFGCIAGNQELKNETSTGFHALVALSARLTQEQVDQFVTKIISSLDAEKAQREVILTLLKVLAFRLDDAQFDGILNRAFPTLHDHSIRVNPDEKCLDDLKTLTALAPLFNEVQAMAVSTKFASLLSNDQSHIRYPAFMLFNTLLISNKLDYDTLQHTLVANFEIKTLLDIMTKIRTDVIQRQNNVSGFELIPDLSPK